MKPIKIKKITAMPVPPPRSKKSSISKKWRPLTDERIKERAEALEELRGLWEDKDDSFFDLGDK